MHNKIAILLHDKEIGEALARARQKSTKHLQNFIQDDTIVALMKDTPIPA